MNTEVSGERPSLTKSAVAESTRVRLFSGVDSLMANQRRVTFEPVPAVGAVMANSPRSPLCVLVVCAWQSVAVGEINNEEKKDRRKRGEG